MVILVSVTLLLAICIFLLLKTNYWDDWHMIWVLSVIVLGVTLFLLLIAIPVNHYSDKVEVERYHVLKQTIENSRNIESSEIERAAILKEIADYNKDLASKKYRNDTIWDWWVYDGLAELDYLE